MQTKPLAANLFMYLGQYRTFFLHLLSLDGRDRGEGAKRIETILQELARTHPEANKMTPESIIDSSIVKDASL